MELPAARVEPTPRWVRVRAGEEWVADSRRALLLAWYGPGMLPTYCFPEDDVRTDLLQPSPSATGDGNGGHDPRIRHQFESFDLGSLERVAQRIAGLVAFFNERVDLVVDGVAQERPHTPWS